MFIIHNKNLHSPFFPISLPLLWYTMPPCPLSPCGTYEMLSAMAFLCPVSPRESDRCSHRTWKPLVMHVSLDHPWWWPEVRKLLPFLWHGNSFEFQHFYDSFGSRSDHSDIEAEGDGERRGGVSRLQVAARSTYGLRQRARSEMSSDCFIGNSPQEYIAFVIISNRFLFETVSDRTVCMLT